MTDLDVYLSLPWTIRRSVRKDDGRYFVLRIDELEGFVVTGRTEEELNDNFGPALRAFLSSFLDEGEVPPVPDSVSGAMDHLRSAGREQGSERLESV